MQEGVRFASSGDEDVKIWDTSSMTVVEQFSPHNSHPVSSVCWGSYSILYQFKRCIFLGLYLCFLLQFLAIFDRRATFLERLFIALLCAYSLPTVLLLLLKVFM